MKWTFDSYLAYQLQGLSFISGGKFTSMDVKRYFGSPTLLRRSRQVTLSKLYKEEFNTSGFWEWNSFNDRIHRHLKRVVKSAGGTRQKIRNKWVYSLSADGFIPGAEE
tara:strand:+ start:542 stop:865 length:324 start_codon:yes stop_codon:yes gene_type:complete